MNENLNLVEILKDCPVGTRLYSTVSGESEFRGIAEGEEPIATQCWSAKGVMGKFYTADGRVTPNSLGECVLFPSKDQRDWSKFKAPIKKFDPKTLMPFDRVIAKLDSDDIYYWFADFVSMPATGYDIVPCIISNKEAEMVIPYNEETKHLVGTSDEAPEYYRYWED